MDRNNKWLWAILVLEALNVYFNTSTYLLSLLASDSSSEGDTKLGLCGNVGLLWEREWFLQGGGGMPLP